MTVQRRGTLELWSFLDIPSRKMLPEGAPQTELERVTSEMPAALPELTANMELSQNQKDKILGAKRQFSEISSIIRSDRQQILQRIKEVSYLLYISYLIRRQPFSCLKSCLECARICIKPILKISRRGFHRVCNDISQACNISPSHNSILMLLDVNLSFRAILTIIDVRDWALGSMNHHDEICMASVGILVFMIMKTHET